MATMATIMTHDYNCLRPMSYELFNPDSIAYMLVSAAVFVAVTRALPQQTDQAYNPGSSPSGINLP